MSISRSAPPRKISAKRLAALGGSLPSRTVRPSGKPMKATNPERQQKVKARQAKKHRAYMASECRRIVDARAEGRCEYVMRFGPDVVLEYTGVRRAEFHRCEETTGLQHHHTCYSLRYGGNELPSDMLVVCKAHHDYLEFRKLAGNRYTRGRA